MPKLPNINTDEPLRPTDALEADRLEREGFARAAVAALKRVSKTSGFVLSLDGPWGSGKTSTMAMIEQVARQDPSLRPVVVHFNPWLVGDRDALLRQFFAAIATALDSTDHVKNATKAAVELRNYSKAFDLVKWIPGAEPWASVIKGVMQGAADALGGAAEQKAKDLEGNKAKLEAELRKFHAPILVFVDDIDRLFPAEIFEMVRIIKAVGQLPNVGYVLAWDPGYVAKALESLSIPSARGYLDKIVQVRLPLPPLGAEAKLRLLDKGMQSLDVGATASHFPQQDARLQTLYHHGLRDLLEQPRDVTRLFNTVSVIEPNMRGEVVLADIIGLACLMLRGPKVYEYFRRHPDVFRGLAIERDLAKNQKQAQADFKLNMDELYASTDNPPAIKALIHHLFPQVRVASDGINVGGSVTAEGHISSSGRIEIALQMGIGSSDASVVQARRFLASPQSRPAVVAGLNNSNALSFLEVLSDIAPHLVKDDVSDLVGTCQELARLVDAPPLSKLAKVRRMFTMDVEDLVLRVIDRVVDSVDPKKKSIVARQVAEDPEALTVAAQILRNHYATNMASGVVCTKSDQPKAARKFLSNVLATIEAKRLWSQASPSLILWSLKNAAPRSGAALLEVLKKDDPTLDHFALHYLKHGYSFSGGQSYALPRDDSGVYKLISIPTLKAHAKKRLQDQSLGYPIKAAWRSVVEGRSIYGADGTYSSF